VRWFSACWRKQDNTDEPVFWSIRWLTQIRAVGVSGSNDFSPAQNTNLNYQTAAGTKYNQLHRILCGRRSASREFLLLLLLYLARMDMKLQLKGKYRVPK
jgi:hypothetical protein